MTHVWSNVLVPTIYGLVGKITCHIRMSNRHYAIQDGQSVHLQQKAKIRYH